MCENQKTLVGGLGIKIILMAVIVLFTALSSQTAAAFSTGITGRTNFSGGAGCGSCHSPSQTLSVGFSGPTTLSILSGTTNYSINVFSAATFTNIGIDVAANGGTLGESVSNLYVSGGEITHQPTLNTTNGSGNGGYTFNFTLPGGATAGQVYTLYGASRVGGAWNQAANYSITVVRANQSALTAYVNGSPAPGPIGVGNSNPLSTTGGSGSGAVTYASLTGTTCTVASTTVTTVGVGTCTVRATKALDSQYNSTFDDVSFTVIQGTQTITFAALSAKLTSDSPFTVSATGGASGNPVTFTASGVCGSGGLNGSTISLTGAAGSCTVTANQASSANYTAASAVMQSFTVVDGGGEVFPPNCQIPPGWITPAGAAQGWQTATDFASPGVCSFKSTTLASTGSNLSSRIAFTGNFNAGNILFKFKVSSEAQFDCFRFLVDGVETSLPGGCSGLGSFVPGVMLGSSGNIDFTQVTVPVSAGTRTIVFSYDKDTSCCSNGLDAAWVDEVSLPLSTSINSATFAFGTFGSLLTYTLTATNFPTTLGASSLPPGLAFNATTGVVSGTPSAAGSFNATVTASNPAGANPAASDLKTVTFLIAKASQSITFAPLNNRLTTSPPFTVSGAGGGSGNPITFTATGVCNTSGTNGATITLTGATGTCSVTPFQAGNANYDDGFGFARSFEVSQSSAEIFPPTCNMPSGWVQPGGSTAGWIVSVNEESLSGACSLKNAPLASSGATLQADIQFTGNFAAGNVTFNYRVSTENNWDCLQFFVDGVAQALGGTCGNRAGLTGASGESGWTSVSVPITAGTRTLKWRYDKDPTCCAGGRDTVWIDDVVMPLFTLTVNATRNGTATGTITSTPTAINCAAPGSCSAPLSGNVLLSPSPGFLSVFSGWSGGGCSGTTPCTVTMDASKSVTGNFTQATPPGALQNVVAAPENNGATITFSAPASDGGSPITNYGGNCSATGQTTVFAGGSSSPTPLVFSGMTNGVQYSCSVAAGNFAGTGPATIVTVTPRTVPSAPTSAVASAGNASATLSFTLSASNGGANISGYTGTCSAAGQTTRTGTAAGSPITVTSLVNGVTYSCSVVATNAAGNSAASNVVSVTPLTVPGAPAITTTAEFDSRVTLNFTPPGSNGGSAILDYEVSCAAAGQATRVVVASASPITVGSMTNNVFYTCTLRARSAAGFGTGPAPVLLPQVRAGSALFAAVCSSCHAGPPSVPQLNAAGSTATVLNDVIVNQPSMSVEPTVTSLTQPERVAISNYLAGTISSAAQTTPFNTPRALDFASQITLGSLSFESLEVVTPPTNGTLSAFTGTGITYTPAVGYTGTDSFTFRGKRTAPTALNGDARTVNLSVLPPPVPVITSGATASGTNGAVFNYQITATNSPTGYGATGLPPGLTVNTMTGAITGPPTVGGTFNATIFASNAGGTGMAAPLTITLNAANQTISFPAQSPGSRAFSPSPTNTFTINPLANSTSGLAITYVSKTLSVCTVSGPTATMLTAGTCTLGANQAGDASYTVATEVTQSVTITPILPGAPTIGAGTPGNNQATIAFTTPANTGGTAITLYSATCTPSGTGTNTVSPIVVGSLTNGTTYTCSVKASNSVGQGPASGTVTVTPAPTPTAPIISSANATTFTVNAPGSFSVTATGTPSTFTYSSTGTLPAGVTFGTTTGVLSGTPTQAGPFLLTFGVSNGVVPDASQSFTLTVAKANQTIAFTNPGTSVFSASAVTLSTVATSSLTVSFVSDTTGVCTVAGANATLVGVGTCTLRAQQSGDANFNAAPDVTQSFSVVQGSQSIAFGAQTTPSAFVANSMFALSPLATASSGLTVAYTSLTTGVCSISATTITMLRAGICTTAANQPGNANYSAAAQVSQSITLTGSAPGAPTISTATGGDTKITVAFTAPASDGGLSISSYTATCGGVTASGAGSPINVIGLVNGMSYSCTVTATNSAGTSPTSPALMATPNVLPGATVWANSCSGCHSNPPTGTRLNVGGSTSAVLDYVLANPTASMGAMVTIVNGSLNAQQKTDVAAYIRDFIPPVSATTSASTAVFIDVGTQVFLTTPSAALTSLQQVSAPANGVLSAFTGTTVTYTPNVGFTGTDTFTYRATQASVNTDFRTVSVTVTQAAPAITSALTASGTVNQAFIYQISATNAPASYGATGLPAMLSINPGTGVISGTPSAGGTTMVTISATNAGGTGNATLAIGVNLIAQTITFGAQVTPRTYVQNGVVMISPSATGGGSMNPIVYSSTTPSVCSVSGATFTMLTAGICTIAANQAGNATYAAAAQVTQSVAITGIAPAAPTIGTAQAGNTQATINFSAPTNSGGLPITSYTVNCNGVTVDGVGSPIVVSGLTNGVSYSCTVQATNLAGTSPVSGSVMVTPVAIAYTGNVYSRKTHAGVGDRDLTLNGMAAIGGTITVEPRSIGSGHRIVFRFNNPVSSVTSVSVEDAAMATVGTATPSYSGNDLIVTLTGIPDNKRVTVTATGVNGALTVSTSIGFLVGDVNSSKLVNAADISAVKARVGQPAGTGNNYLFDLDASGSINNADVSAVKARSGLALP